MAGTLQWTQAIWLVSGPVNVGDSSFDIWILCTGKLVVLLTTIDQLAYAYIQIVLVPTFNVSDDHCNSCQHGADPTQAVVETSAQLFFAGRVRSIIPTR